MKKMTLLSGVLISFAQAELAQVSKAQIKCEVNSCALELQFSQEKSNPTISQSLTGGVLHLNLGKTQLNLQSQSFKTGPLKSIAVKSLGSDRYDLAIQSKDALSQGFKKIERVDSKTVRFVFDLKSKTSAWSQSLVQSTASASGSISLGHSADQAFFSQFAKEQSKTKITPSSSQSFALQKTPRPMVFVADAQIFEMADMKSKPIASAVAAKVVDRLELKAEWVKVRTKSGKIGYALRNKLVYEDELNSAQKKQWAELLKSPKRFELNPVAQVASNSKDSAVVVSMATPESKHFVYSSFGRRDPFVPVKLPEVEGISIDDVRLVGIIWNSKDPIAIFEDQKVPERNYSLRIGDAVMNGMVKKITQNGVVFTLNDFGVVRQYSMSLPKEQK